MVTESLMAHEFRRGSFVSPFPEEIMDIIFQELLPDALSFFTHFQNVPAPYDLMQCRLACHLFNRLAAPFVWRRLQMRLSYTAQSELDLARPPPVLRPWSANKRRNIKRSRNRVVEICSFLNQHPETCRHIRLFSLSAVLPLNLDDSTLTPAFSSLISVIPLLINIGILCLELPRGCASLVPVEICIGLLSIPSLQIVKFLRNETLELCPSILKTMRNLRQLVIGSVCHGQSRQLLYSLLPSVEVLRGGLTEKMPNKLPWSSLKEVEFISLKSSRRRKHDVMKDFLSWKRQEGFATSPLVQLGVPDRQPVALEHYVLFFQLFVRLPLILVPEVNVSLFERLFSAFPALNELTLIDNVYLMYNAKDEESYAPLLHPRVSLKTSTWNYIETGIITNCLSWDEISGTGFALLPAKSRGHIFQIVDCTILKPKSSYQIREFRVIRGMSGEIRCSGPIYAHWHGSTSVWSNTQFITPYMAM